MVVGGPVLGIGGRQPCPSSCGDPCHVSMSRGSFVIRRAGGEDASQTPAVSFRAMTLAPFESASPTPTAASAMPNVPLPEVRNEAIKAAELASMKRKATGLLCVAAVVFLVAIYFETRYPWVVWVRAGAEAAMVGGLADWFAVTALFRHPLGIPIPHTAIIPTRKERIARILADFFERNFFTREVLAERLHQLGLAERLGSWLANPENARTISRQLVRAAAGAADAVPEDTARAFVDRSIVGRLRGIPAAPVAARAIESLMTGRRSTRNCSTGSWAWSTACWRRTATSSGSGSGRSRPGGCRTRRNRSSTRRSWARWSGRCWRSARIAIIRSGDSLTWR